MSPTPPPRQTPERERPKGPKPGSAIDLGRVWAVGGEFAATVGGAAIIGYAFDHFLGTGPWGMMGWLLFGLLYGFVRLIREAGRLNREAMRKGSPPPPREP